jgi:hypothetical protein
MMSEAVVAGVRTAVYGGGGGGGGGVANTLGFAAPLVAHLRAKMPPMSVRRFIPETIDNTMMMVPQVRTEDGLLYIMIAPSIVIAASVVQ